MPSTSHSGSPDDMVRVSVLLLRFPNRFLLSCDAVEMVKIQAACSTETLVFYHFTTRRHSADGRDGSVNSPYRSYMYRNAEFCCVR
jgi:hypothetical protein